jgi:1-phosphatidylinositol phosphodiesterase
MDTDGVVHLTQFNSSEQVWQQPYRIFGAWKCLFTPTLALHSDNAYMCLNDTDGCIYVTSYDTKAHQWTNPNYKGSNLFNGWETYCNRTPSIISYQGTLRMALMDHKGGVFTSKWVNNIWTSPEKLFGDWKCYYSPTFSIFDGNLYMAICDTSGRTYVTTYDTPTSSWNAPIYQKTELFEGGETYACIPAKMCETSLNRLIPMIGLKNWMLPLDSTKLISEVTIPGTHDSGAHQGGAGAECQTMSIEQQLNRGIRYFDIRCRHIQDRFAIYHGAYRQDLLFGNDVLKICLDFLKNNPTEFLVFAIQSASSEKDNSRSFEETFRWYIGEKYQCDANWYLKNEIPSIQDVRGKIILIRRFSADTILGIDANGSKWNSDVDSCEFKFSDTQTLSIQDHNYVTTIFNLRDKWNLIKSQLDKAKNAIDKNTLYLNFSSGSGGAFPKDIAKASSPGFTGENYRLDEELSSNPKGHYGILAMDYPETPTDLIGRIISSNPEIF